MKRTIDTGIDKTLAKKAIDKAMGAYLERFAKYRPRFAWKGEDSGDFAFEVKGVSLTGHVAIGDATIEVDMDVPVLLRVFQKRALRVIGDHVALWVDQARRGELD